MSTVNRWSKMAGLLNEAAEPQSQEQEVHESTQEIAVSENIMNADKLRSLISEIANEILSEARASNSDVELIQMALKGVNQGDSEKANELGLQGKIGNIVADGMFGKNTKASVEKFQTAAGLSSDGIVGPGTLNALLGMFEAGGARDNAYKAQIQNLIDRKIVARLGSGIGKKSSKPAAPEAPEPAAPGENPLDRVLKNLVKRLKTSGEDVDEVDVKAAIMKNMKENPEFSTNILDLSKDPNPSQSRLMRLVANTVMASLGASDDTAIGGGEAGDAAELTPSEKPALSQDFDRIIDKDEGEFGALGL